MRSFSLAVIVVCLGWGVCLGEPPLPTFKKFRLTDKFYAEGAYYADFNKDGKLDVVAGPFWYEGPDFPKKHEICPPKAYDPQGLLGQLPHLYGRFQRRRLARRALCALPGKEAYWYENPAGKGGPWKQHLALKDVGNESPMWVDINGDGRPELIYNTTGYLGYATYDPAKPDEPWIFHAVTPKGDYQRYTHGIGCGDINGDGRMDIVEVDGWWEQPGRHSGERALDHCTPSSSPRPASQMFVYDVDGDGLNDVITALALPPATAWYGTSRSAPQGRNHLAAARDPAAQARPEIRATCESAKCTRVDLVDMNGDGLKDIVDRQAILGPRSARRRRAQCAGRCFTGSSCGATSKRACSSFRTRSTTTRASACQVTAVDLNGDGIPDVIVSNKKGTFIHLSQPSK